MVIPKRRPARRQKQAIQLTSRWAVLSFAGSAWQPDFMTLWNLSIFQRMAYPFRFSRAAASDGTGRSVINFQLIFSRPKGCSRSWASSTVSVSAGSCFCLAAGGSTEMRRKRISTTASEHFPCLSCTGRR